MSVLPQLAHSLGRRDEVPNQELAAKIARENDKPAVNELVETLYHKSKDIQHDCIKVLYEVGVTKPAMIMEYLPVFLSLLQSKNNRMQWGAMIAIDMLTLQYPEAVYTALPAIIEAADKGSVITRDHAVFILIKLCQVKKYSSDAFELLAEQLRTCPANQLPMYAERTFPVVTKCKAIFSGILRERMVGMETESKRKRLEKLVKKLAEP